MSQTRQLEGDSAVTVKGMLRHDAPLHIPIEPRDELFIKPNITAARTPSA